VGRSKRGNKQDFVLSLKENKVINTISLSMTQLIICFTSRSRIFHLYGDVTITGEGLQNLGYAMLGAQGLEQGGIFIVPHLL
jgi:hypothetical protein